MKEFDLLVIGAGPGGYVAAIRGAQLGLKTAVVEKEPSFGGTCLRVGCIPSKALLESSERFQAAKEELAEHGVRCGGVELDLAAMMKRKDKIVQTLGRGVAALFKKHKIESFAGHGSFLKPGQVEVVNGDKKEVLTAKHIIIATGSVPSALPGVQPDGNRVGTSTEALNYDSVPEHLVVIGGGYIGLELGSVWNRLGSQVTVVEYLDRILPGIDSGVASEAHKAFANQGLDFRLGSKVMAAKSTTKGAQVEIEGQDPIDCDQVLLAVGRRPNTEGLGLERIGVELDDRKRIPVGEGFRTVADGVYAIGDVIPGPMLAHKAEEEGVACAELIAGHHPFLNYDCIPAVVYTHPEIATVGKTEDELKNSGVHYNKGEFPFAANGRARALGDISGRVKVLADEKTDRILGVHIIGPRAGDLIAEAAVAMNFGASSTDLALTCHAHPTLAEAVKEAAFATTGQAIHA